jgi:hypothetical protein
MEKADQKGSDGGRVEQIVRIDTGALLNVIRELEAKLSDHHRQVRLVRARLRVRSAEMLGLAL